MKKVMITTSTNEKVLEQILKQYSVHVVTNDWGYKEMQFETTDSFARNFFKVMHHLLDMRIYITVIDMLVETKVYKEQAYILAGTGWCNEPQYETEQYNNYVHQHRDIDLTQYL